MATRVLSAPLARQSPLLRPAMLLLALTVFLGTLFSLRTESAVLELRSRTPSSGLGSAALDGLAYFKDKRNLVNVVFVKRAWGWTTLLWALYMGAVWTYDSIPNRAERLKRHGRTFLGGTLVWFYMTQATWFFSFQPSLAHLILLYTGASCPLPSSEGDQGSWECRNEHGRNVWQGGHDVSGHIFILVLASILLLDTISPSLVRLFPSYFPPSSVDPAQERKTTIAPLPLPIKLATYATLALVGIWWFMLLNTSLFFHHWTEKMSGLAFGVAGWWAVAGGQL